ncbi:MAG: tetratricopeptide repeat protein [Nitrospirae bacterium]|nr:tetratricopeptide repeat protein [Nitrospirota bacterium]
MSVRHVRSLPYIYCLIAAVILAASSSPAHAYKVYLKGGSTMEVRSHRVEGGKVYLKMKSGELAFDREQLDLEKTDADFKAYQGVLDRAEALTNLGDIAGAVNLYGQLLAQDAEDVRVRFLLGAAHTASKKYDEAEYEFRRVLELDPAWPGARTRLGDVYFRQGNYNDAIDQYLKALDDEPNDRAAHLGFGMCYAKQDMYEGARTELFKAIELYPEYAEAYSMLGYVYYKKSEFESAITSLKKSIAMDGSLADAHYYLGLVYGVLGVEASDSSKRRDYFDKSIESFRMAVQIRRDFPEAHADLGVAFYQRGSVARAVEEFKIALEQKPDMALAHNNLAGIYLRQSFYEEAVSEAKKAVAIDPHLIESYFIMGNAYANMRKYAEAARAYDRFLYYSPDGDLSDEVRLRLERVVKEGGLKGPADPAPAQGE